MIIITTQCYFPNIGGIEALMTGMAQAFKRNGREVIVFADGKINENDKRQDFHLLRFNHWKPIRRRLKAKQINRLAKSKNIELIIADSWKSAEHLNNLGVKIFILAHGTEIQKIPFNILNFYKHFKNLRIIRSFNKADKIIANSSYTKNLLINNVNISSNKIKVIHPGVEFNNTNFDIDIDNKIKKMINKRNPVIITLARLEERKGHKFIIEAITRLKIKYPDILYLIAGDGEYKKNIYEYAKLLDVQNYIKFLGWVDEPEKSVLLQNADLFVMTPGKGNESVESFGMVFIDANLNGLAVIGSDNGGMADAILDGKTGLLAKTADIDDITYKIDSLLSNKEKRDSLGKYGKEYAVSRYPWDQKIKEYLNLI